MAGSSQRHYSTVAVVVVVLLTPWTATALPSADGILEHRPTQAVVAPRETFGNGFPPGFADNLPTKEFTGDFTRRVRRQAGITSDIDSILSGPYGGALDNDHLQALLLRNINIRPARQSPGHPRESRPPPRPSLSSSSSSSSTRFSSSPQGSFRPQQESRSPGPPSPGRPLPRPSLSSSASRFSSPPPGSFRPQQEPRSPDPPSADRPSPPSLFQAPRDPPPRFSPPRFTSSNPPLHSQPQERQEPFSSDSFTGQQFDSFSDIDSFFDSARLPRQRRDVAAAAAPRDDAGSTQHIFVSPEEDTVPESSSGFIVGKPADFPGFASIGGFGPMEDVDKTDVAGSFMQTINFPSVEFGPIDDSHPPFPQNPSFPQTPSFPEQVSELHDFPLDLLSISQKAIERSPPPDNNNSEYNDIFDNLYREDFERFSNNDDSDKLSDDSFDNLNNNKDKDSIDDNFDQQLTANPHTNKLTSTEGFRPIIPQHPPPPTLNPLTFSPSPPLPQHPALSRPPTLTPPSLPPPPPPAPSHVLFPNTVPNPKLSRPNPQPYRIQRIRTKRPNSGLASGIVSRLRDFVQPSASRPLRTLRQKTQDVELNSDMETRRRRGVPDEDEEDPIESQFASLIPHKRVHRVQTESHAPHSRKPREDTDMDTSPAELPHYFSSVSNFEFPRLQPRHRQSPTVSRSAHVTSQFSSHHSPVELRREDRHHPPHTQEPDYLQPDGQRFYPSFNGHISPSSRAPFFPSRPIPPHAPGPRGSRFLTRGVGFRERPNTTPRDPVGFRELHHQGPPVRETSSHIKPDAAFSASRRPFHREQEHFGHDNSILGSGNFEVLRGGTFYDLEDTNGHQHYDHLLHGDDFGFFPAVQPPSPPHTNYVDDFFSNFRDFSEFAKRSDEGESTYVEDEYNPESYSRGYGSEHIHHFAPSNITLEVGNVTLANITEPNTKSENANSSPVTKKNTTTVTGHTKQTHRRPNNIQEVLEEVDSHPSDYTASTTTVEEKDPMIAMF
ncbi:uncharacterized protein LOC123507032 isoform X1 [Portunus trituberculatus]|uniref:uncharacterized protein LOC123507032 isoform X1 n=1 Tax=Portunus trituberculatus TaxID=210409 RepID=UPI001E1CC4FC|nr:uncharacterized protein LOC123507032 isoform X1 [Portunus trituberculatus]